MYHQVNINLHFIIKNNKTRISINNITPQNYTNKQDTIIQTKFLSSLHLKPNKTHKSIFNNINIQSHIIKSYIKYQFKEHQNSYQPNKTHKYTINKINIQIYTHNQFHQEIIKTHIPIKQNP